MRPYICFIFLFVLILVSAAEEYDEDTDSLQDLQKPDDLDGVNLPFYGGIGKRLLQNYRKLMEKNAATKDFLRMYLKLKQY
uniref:Uncharacterized protein n=1 Tax=Plectus sambesii TaxID=2011161 RepID=A0A914W3P9_9BILA